MPTPKTSKHFSQRTLLIAGALITVAVVGFIYLRKKQSSGQASAAFSQDTTGGLPGQNYLPATGNFGASQLGDGVAAPPPCPTGQVWNGSTCACPDGSSPNADGSCGDSTQPPPTQNPPTYKHSCFDGAGPGCGGPNRHCEYWTVYDGSGQPQPPADCIPKGGNTGGGSAPNNQSPTQAPGQAPVTSDVLSSLGTTAPNSVATTPGVITPPALSDPSVRMLHITQAAGRADNPSDTFAGFTIGPVPPPQFPPISNTEMAAPPRGSSPPPNRR